MNMNYTIRGPGLDESSAAHPCVPPELPIEGSDYDRFAQGFVPEQRSLPGPGTLLAEGFRRAVLKFLVKNCAIAEELRSRMLGRRRARSRQVNLRLAQEPLGRLL